MLEPPALSTLVIDRLARESVSAAESTGGADDGAGAAVAVFENLPVADGLTLCR